MSADQTKATIYYGETQCCATRKSNNKPCPNKAYFKGQLCGQHKNKQYAKELPKNPNAKENKLQELAEHAESVEKKRNENHAAGIKGSLRLYKMRMRHAIPLTEGVKNVFPNFRHQNRVDGFGCSSLSPMKLGPVEHDEMGLPPAKNVENYHQMAKVYKREFDTSTNTIKPEFWVKLAEGYEDVIPHRHKYPGDSKSDILFCARKDAKGKITRCSYVESRLFYCNAYEKLVVLQADFAKVKKMLEDGYDLQICGYDSPYNPSLCSSTFASEILLAAELRRLYLSSAAPFGHELVLFSLFCLPSHLLPWKR